MLEEEISTEGLSIISYTALNVWISWQTRVHHWVIQVKILMDDARRQRAFERAYYEHFVKNASLNSFFTMWPTYEINWKHLNRFGKGPAGITPKKLGQNPVSSSEENKFKWKQW